MKTIEELFVNEYEQQKETIKKLNGRIETLTARIDALQEGIRSDEEHYQATIDEIKAIGLKLMDRATYISANVWGIRDKEEARERFPILVDAGCIEFPEENEDGTK